MIWEGSMSFSEALLFIKRGCKLRRRGWNDKDVFIFKVDGSQFAVNRPPLLGIYEEGHIISYHAHIDMKTANGAITMWTPSQIDLFEVDWEIVE